MAFGGGQLNGAVALTDVFGVVANEQQKYLRDAVIRAARELRQAPHVKGARRLRKLLEALALFGLDPENLPEPGPVPEGGWGQLAHVIRTDEPLRTEPADLQRFHDYLWQAGAAAARELWEQLKPDGPLRAQHGPLHEGRRRSRSRNGALVDARIRPRGTAPPEAPNQPGVARPRRPKALTSRAPASKVRRFPRNPQWTISSSTSTPWRR